MLNLNNTCFISIIIIFILLILYYTRENYQNKEDKTNKFYKSTLNINDFQDIIAMRDSSELQNDKS
jgi:ABC-type multidrug transport system permease subunit